MKSRIFSAGARRPGMAQMLSISDKISMEKF